MRLSLHGAPLQRVVSQNRSLHDARFINTPL